MKTGTKSLLFGVHQFIWHPITVWLAWVWLYHKLPTFKETICIVIHDWGYWGKSDIDGENGERHPETGAKMAHTLFDTVPKLKWVGHPCQDDRNIIDLRDKKYYNFCLLHSRHYARNAGKEPSALCWADKLSIIFEPWWLYLPRAWASGELVEYRRVANQTCFVPSTASHRDWYRCLQERLSTLGRSQCADIVPYANPIRNPADNI